MIICMLNLSASNFKIKIKQYLANHNFIIMIISIEIWCVKEGDTPVEYFLDNWTTIFMRVRSVVYSWQPRASKAQSRNLQTREEPIKR